MDYMNLHGATKPIDKSEVLGSIDPTQPPATLKSSVNSGLKTMVQVEELMELRSAVIGGVAAVRMPADNLLLAVKKHERTHVTQLRTLFRVPCHALALRVESTSSEVEGKLQAQTERDAWAEKRFHFVSDHGTDKGLVEFTRQHRERNAERLDLEHSILNEYSRSRKSVVSSLPQVSSSLKMFKRKKGSTVL